MDCCVKNVIFLCLSGGILHGLSPHFGVFLSRSHDPKYERNKNMKQNQREATQYEIFQPIRKFLTILR